MKKILCVLALLIIMVSAYFSPIVYRNFKNSIQDNKLTITTNESEKKTSQRIVLVTGDYVCFGSYLNEPIIWKVLNIEPNGKTLLISEKIICFKAFNACGQGDKENIDSDIEAFGSSKWETSTLKQWLNSSEKTVSYSHSSPKKECVYKGYNAYDDEPGFLCDDNFSDSQRKIISCEGIFIPSKEMLQKNLSKSELKKNCTQTAASYNSSPYIVLPQQTYWYWTSSALNKSNVSVIAVTSSGSFYKTLAFDSSTGVCPALYLNSNKVNIENGNGTLSEPYIIEK